MIVLARMNRILRVDVEARRALVQPGVVNQDITRVVEHAGQYFAPDPSSQKACTIGGNVAENAGDHTPSLMASPATTSPRSNWSCLTAKLSVSVANRETRQVMTFVACWLVAKGRSH